MLASTNWVDSSSFYRAPLADLKVEQSIKSSKISGQFAQSSLSMRSLTGADIKAKFMNTVDLMPDLFTLADSTKEILQHTRVVVPVALRVACASIGTICALELPGLVQDIWKLIHQISARIHKGVRPLDALKLAYLSTLVALMTALTALGLKEFCSLLKLSPTYLDCILAGILPWLGYGLRLAMIPQTIDIFSGMRFESKINDVLSLKERTVVGMDSHDSTIECAVKALDVIKGSRSFIRRANGSGQGLKGRVRKLELQLQTPTEAGRAARETIDLAYSLRNRSISHVEVQILGLGANLSVIGATLCTNVVGAALLSMLSASYFLTQTSRRWYMAPVVTRSEPKPMEVFRRVAA